MYPSLHKTVADKVIDDIGVTHFRQHDTDRNIINEHNSHVMGRFRCPKDSCSSGGWTSKKVAIRIRDYGGGEYNAVVFNQRCSSCESLGWLTLDEDSYVERVAYRLKFWAGVKMERPAHSGREGPPHRSDLCEGCRLGYCQERGGLEGSRGSGRGWLM
ncbi:hypothetical protein VUR80DRAFT_2942 [Thermomyces stellatus]